MFVKEGKERSRERVRYSATKYFEKPEEVLGWIEIFWRAHCNCFFSLISEELYFCGAERLSRSWLNGYRNLTCMCISLCCKHLGMHATLWRACCMRMWQHLDSLTSLGQRGFAVVWFQPQQAEAPDDSEMDTCTTCVYFSREERPDCTNWHIFCHSAAYASNVTALKDHAHCCK